MFAGECALGEVLRPPAIAAVELLSSWFSASGLNEGWVVSAELLGPAVALRQIWGMGGCPL